MYVTIPTTYDNMANDLRHGWTYFNGAVVSPEGVVYPVAASFAATLVAEGSVERGHIHSRMCLGLHKKRPIPLIEGSKQWREAMVYTDEIMDEIPMSELVPGWKYRSKSGETFIWLGELYVKEFTFTGNNGDRKILDTRALFRLKVCREGTTHLVKTPKVHTIAVLEELPFPDDKLIQTWHEQHRWANTIYSRDPLPTKGVFSTREKTSAGWSSFHKCGNKIYATKHGTRKVHIKDGTFSLGDWTKTLRRNNPVHLYVTFGPHTVEIDPPQYGEA